MSRRRLVAVVAAVLLLGLTLGVVALIVATQSRAGQNQIRAWIESELAGAATGKVYLGAIHGSLVTDVTIDSIEIRGADDSLLIASGPISVEYDPRDILDKRILLRHLRIERPIIRLTQYNNDSYNIARIFAGKPADPAPLLPTPIPTPAKALKRGFGDILAVDSVEIINATFILREPWRPDSTLRGAARDSLIRWQLARTDVEVRRVDGGYARYRRWNDLSLTSPRMRIAHPDTSEMLFVLSHIETKMTDPPLDIRHLDGTARIRADSLWLDVPNLELPSSHGIASGKVVWGSHLPARWNVHIDGDTVAMADVAWAYKNLPDSGGGHSQIDIRSDLRNPHITDYVLTDMDVVSTKSRLVGNMTFRTGGRVLEVNNVALRGAPLDFALIKVLAGGAPFPVPWAGQFTGTVRGRGGPVDRFRLDAMAFSFADANVRGATTQATGAGELDITEPSLAVFRGFAMDVARLDIRTPRFLFADFPGLNGQVAGHVLLDSIWTDVRFSDATITHTDSAGPPSTFTGNGRITVGDPLMIFDATLQAAPFSFSTFALSYPGLPLRGSYTGPIRVQGTTEELALNTVLTGPAGTLEYSGTLDGGEPVYGATGDGILRGVDLVRLLDRPDLPATRLDGAFHVAVQGDALSTATGLLEINLGASMVDSLTVFPSRARVRFDRGILRIDTVLVVTTAGTARASGTLGIVEPQQGPPVNVAISVDSLVGLRRYLKPFLSDDPEILAADTLRGSATVTGTLSGTLDDLVASGAIAGSGLGIGTTRTPILTGEFDIADPLDHPVGSLTLRADSLFLGDLRFHDALMAFDLADTAETGFRVEAKTPVDKSAIRARGAIAMRGDSILTRLDTLSVDISADVRTWWRLATPVRIVSSPAGLRFSEFTMGNPLAGRLTVAADLPTDREITFRLRADSVPLDDLGRLAQMESRLGGWVTFDATAAGLRGAPLWSGTGRLIAPRTGTTQLDRVDATFSYANRRLITGASLIRSGQEARIRASWPVNLAFVPVARRRVADTLSGTFLADNADLRLLETFTSLVQSPSGRLSADLRWSGTWEEPVFDGSLRISDGALLLAQAGIAIERLNADLLIARDTIRIRRFSAQSGASRGDTAWVEGSVAINRLSAPIPDIRLHATNFRAMNIPRVADITINADLSLTPSRGESELNGFVQVTRGALYIPELASKRLIDVEDLMPEATRERAVLPTVLASMNVGSVNVQLLNDVWLRSAQRNVNVQLSGGVDLSVVTVPAQRTPFGSTASTDSVKTLALEGRLAADRGEYSVDLGFVRRKFQVQSGSIEFNGGPDLLQTALDITGEFTVRQPAGRDNGRDLAIQVRLTGTLANPEVSVAAANDNLSMSQADLLSYLAFGAPFYDIGGAGTAQLQTAASILLPSLASSFSDRFAGGALDLVQLETARIDTIAASGVRNVLGNTRLALGKQIGARTFVSANTSFCKLGGIFTSTEDLIQSLGIKVEQRLGHDYSASLAVEPGTTGATCREASPSSRALISTPRQLGLDLYKIWRF